MSVIEWKCKKMMVKPYPIYLLIVLLVILLSGGCGSTDGRSVAPDRGHGESDAAESYVLEEAAPCVVVEGNVDNPFEFKLSDFEEQLVTISAEKRKCKETDPQRDFTGVPLLVVLKEAAPFSGTTKLTIIAEDGHQKNYVLEDVLLDESMIISEQDGILQIVAGNSQKYDASYWVKGVTTMVIK